MVRLETLSTKLAEVERELDAIPVCSGYTYVHIMYGGHRRNQLFALLLNLFTLPTKKHMLPRRNVALIYAVACKSVLRFGRPQRTQPLPAKTEIS